MNADDKAAWIARYQSVSKLQARYLWLLMVLGIFYWAVNEVIHSETRDVLRIPVVDLELSATVVWASGPAVLAFLLVCFHGTLRAVDWARIELDADADEVAPDYMEKYDVAPNALDMAAYTTSKTPLGIVKVLSFAYPLALTAFTVEAGWLLWAVFDSDREVSAKVLFLAVGGLLLGVSTIKLAEMWWLRAKRFPGLRRKGGGTPS